MGTADPLAGGVNSTTLPIADIPPEAEFLSAEDDWINGVRVRRNIELCLGHRPENTYRTDGS